MEPVCCPFCQRQSIAPVEHWTATPDPKQHANSDASWEIQEYECHDCGKTFAVGV